MPWRLPLLALFLTGCSQTGRGPAASTAISIESRCLVFPASSYAHLASRLPQLFPASTARPSDFLVLDNGQLTALFSANNLRDASTITVPRATVPNHHSRRIPLVMPENHAWSVGGPPPPQPPFDTRSTLTVTPTLTGDHRIRVAIELAYTPLISGASAADNPHPYTPADPPSRVRTSVTLASKQVALIGPYPTTDTHGQAAQVLMLIRPTLIGPPTESDLVGPK